MTAPTVARPIGAEEWLPLVNGDRQAADIAARAEHWRICAATERRMAASWETARKRPFGAAEKAENQAKWAREALAEHLDGAADVHPLVLALARPDLATASTGQAA